MAIITQPLREEHKHLLPHIEQLRLAGDQVGETASPALKLVVDEAVEFLTGHLLPHAHAEEKALYPAVQRAMGAALATATMSRDHVEVGRLTEELLSLRRQLEGAALTPDQVRDLRRTLYGLYALVKVHFAKEEEVYLPLLDERLGPEEARAMFAAMEAAAGEARHHRAHG